MVPNRAKHHILSSIHENFNNTEAELRKSIAYKKSVHKFSPLNCFSDKLIGNFDI